MPTTTTVTIAIGLLVTIFNHLSVQIDAATAHHVTVRNGGSIWEAIGSTEGDTLLWIYGDGFSQQTYSITSSTEQKNKVQFVGNNFVYDCRMNTEEETNTQLACYTPPMPSGQYTVKLYVNGIDTPFTSFSWPFYYAIFQSSPSNTPSISNISPRTGSPQRLVTLSGQFYSDCYSVDVGTCLNLNTAMISRIYIGNYLCNLIDPISGVAYSVVNRTYLQCRFDSNEVGIFNVSMIVTNEYGRSKADSSLYRMSATGELYNFQSYALVSNVTPNKGSIDGGTILTIDGNYFSNSSQNALVVNVGGEPCTILSVNLTTILCQTSPMSVGNISHYHGGHGLHIFRESVFTDLSNLSNINFPMPSANANMTWTEEASFVSSDSSPTTVWIIGFLRPPKTALFKFQLESNIASALYLSSNDDPANKVQIATNVASSSNSISLQNNTNYYMLCIGSTWSGNIRLLIKAKMQGTSLTSSDNSGMRTIQKINIGSEDVIERQRIVYTTISSNSGTSEIQNLPNLDGQFQLGFEGVYTEIIYNTPYPEVVQGALNNLPTIHPLVVNVSLVGLAYRVTFPSEMGDVPLITMISTEFTVPKNATEIVKGIASGSYAAFQLDGARTNYLNFGNTITNEMLQQEFMNLFSIRCPSSINNKIATPDIVYVDDFEIPDQYNEAFPITDTAFCGRNSLRNQYLVRNNTNRAEQMCFAYRIPYGASINLNFDLRGDDDPITTIRNIPLPLRFDAHWHYQCIGLSEILEQYYVDYFLYSTIVIVNVYLNNYVADIMFDTVTLRSQQPSGYENENQITSMDQSASDRCRFPFFYNGQSYYSCILNDENLPICRSTGNQTYYCQNSSIEGVRRLFPKYQLLHNSLSLTHQPLTHTIDISFRYASCIAPSLVEILPSTFANVTSLTNSIAPVGGYYDILFKGETYRSIPAKITSSDLTNLLQSFPNFGYVSVSRTGECFGYSYTIEWLSNGPQPLIEIVNTTGLRPIGVPINVSLIQRGFIHDTFYDLPNDMIQTYHEIPQVVVVIGGYSSYCSNVNNSCPFEWTIEQTPTVLSVVQNATTLAIAGTGFSSSLESNIVSIGEKGSCNVTKANATSIVCSIISAPSGRQTVRVNILGTGFARINESIMIIVPLSIISFSPSEGERGGGYNLTIVGNGFSSNTEVMIGENLCRNPIVNNLTSIRCIVPPSSSANFSQVTVTVIDGSNRVNAIERFTYNMTNTLFITSIHPTVVTMIGGLLNITGTGFRNETISVFIGTTKVSVVSLSFNFILVSLSKLAPGMYPVTVQTSTTVAQSPVNIEYQFYLQQISPQVGSTYGGSDVYVQGEGFNNLTKIQFRDQNNRVFPCDIISTQLNQIHCRTTSNVRQVTITSNGIHPTYGIGYAWSPPFQIVQRGTNVTWEWSSPQPSRTLNYTIQQVMNAISTDPTPNGFDSGSARTSGSFSYQFDILGTYYYWSPMIDSSLGISIRGVIQVIDSESELLTVEATWNEFTAQKCTFPFTFDSIQYTECTSVNDTRLWCSPTSIYSGQRLYCTPTIPSPVSSCSANILNTSLCSQTAITPSSPLHFVSTLCTVDTFSSISPKQGPAGTLMTIIGTNFIGNICEYDIEIGSSFHCPIRNLSTNQITCEITAGSTLDVRTNQIVRVHRIGQGYLGSQGPIKFQLQPSIRNISPTIGSIYGGTQIIIDGDGFIPNNTLIFIGNQNITHFELTSSSQIIITTELQTTYVDLNLPVYVFVYIYRAVCLAPSCEYSWTTSRTPYLDSMNTSVIRGPTTILFTGRNLLAGGVGATNAHVTIGDIICNVTQMTNESLTCSIEGIEAGQHQVIGYIEGIGNIRSSLNITSEPFLLRISPTTSGAYGGILLTIEGNGFSSNISQIQVRIGSNLCPVVQANESHIKCMIPAQGISSNVALIQVISNQINFLSLSLFLNYSTAQTPNITSINPTFGGLSQILLISGDNFISTGQTSVQVGDVECNIINFTMTTIICTPGSDLSAGNHSVVVHLDGVGDSNSDLFYTRNLSITNVTPSVGGYGGGLEVNIFGDGFNGTNVFASICNRNCSSVTIVSNSQLKCITPSFSISEVNSSCNLTIEVNGISDYRPFIYSTNLTATITSVSPTRGGTGGGTLITINGTNFPNSTNDVTVNIGGAQCFVTSVTTTSITCTTGTYRRTGAQTFVTVLINNNGYAIGTVEFQYIDLWSSVWTWGGDMPPEAGTLVVIDNGTTIYLDIETPILKVLVIDNATLIFDDLQDVTLNVEYIVIVNGGRLQVGTESNPFQHRGVITIYGHLRSIELPIYGAKVLALREGILDMHGKPTVRTWTQLATTAINGSPTITVQQPVDWSINSQIIIATTSHRFSQRESELRRITYISPDRLTLTLDKPLLYTHLGVTQDVNTTTIEVRAEVGLLTHNVLFQGSITATWNDTIEACPDGFNPDEFAVQTCYLGRYGEEIGSDEFGARIMVSQGTNSPSSSQRVVVRLSNIEMYNVGQAYRLDRYAIYFQSNGNMNESYVKSSSIHLSFNRAIHIQASHYITVENNVIYNIMGNAMILENGIEIGNVFRSNLAVFVRSSSSLLNEDLTPAAFWLTNPNNIVENNAAAGCTHFGYWYRLLLTPDGIEWNTYTNYCPYKQPFGRFINNSVHSTGRFGVWVYPQYAPTISGNCNDNQPSQAVFEGLISWKNNKGIELVMARTIQIKNAIVFDNADVGIAYITAIDHQNVNPTNLRPTFYDINTGSSIIDSIIIGDSGISPNPIGPSTAGLIVMWDRGLRIQNITFINFNNNQTPAILGPIILDRCTYGCGGWLTKFSNISFINVLLRGSFRWKYDGIYEDEDGTLNGLPNSVLMAPDGINNLSSTCTVALAFDNAIACPLSEGAWIRMSLWYYSYNDGNLGQLSITNGENSSTIVPWRLEQLTHPKGYMAVLRANQTYMLSFAYGLNNINFKYNGVFYDVAPGDYLIVEHSIVDAPDGARTVLPSLLSNRSFWPLSSLNNSNGDWYFDNTTSRFSYIVENPSTANSSIDIEIHLELYRCPCSGCNCPTTTTTTTTTTTSTSATTETTTTATTTTTTTETTTTATTTTATTTTTSTTTTTQGCYNIHTKYWSIDSDWTFGAPNYYNTMGSKPGNDADIFVPCYIELIIDYSSPSVRSLTIEGIVRFQEGKNYIFRTSVIIINGGRLIAGLPGSPFNGSINIIMGGSGLFLGPLPFMITAIESRTINVFGGLDLHGLSHNKTWTRLNQPATSGQNLIVLSESVDWTVGDEIIVTTTDADISHTERHHIASIVNGTIIRTVSPLTYTHNVIAHMFPNQSPITVAAAVGLLTRNIRISNENSSPNRRGFRLLINEYQVLGRSNNSARLSNTQFIGFGQLINIDNDDQQSGIYINRLNDRNSIDRAFITACSFDSGFNAAITIIKTNDIQITDNVIYNTYRSGIVITNRNNVVRNNLVTTIYWKGSGQSISDAQFNMNFDGAIMSRDAINVVMQDNLVAGVERLAYRIQGVACPESTIQGNIMNIYSNNEAHSAMSGVNLWPSDKGFVYDRKCVMISGFKVYKAWYYAFYINTARNITIDSCTSIDSQVGIFAYVIGPSALTHNAYASRVTIQNSIVIGSITPNDCNDMYDPGSINIQFSEKGIPAVSARASPGYAGDRVGIVFPTFSPSNNMPLRPWTGIGFYPCLSGLMSIVNTTIAFFNYVCDRHDRAIQVSQSNDDGQFPIITRLMSVYNTSREHLIFNGQPNLKMVNPSACGDMDCDGLKKALITDIDGTFFGQRASVFSWAESLWGDRRHGIGDYRIPKMAITNLTGHRIDINATYPYRGISRSNSCSLQPLWGMYICNNTMNYRMLIIESMDSDTERRRLSPVAIVSKNGYIDLLNGPQNHGICYGYACQRRISTFMAIIECGVTYEIYFTSTPPKHIRLRLLNADSTIKCILAISYNSVQQIDVYANSVYQPPTNKDYSSSALKLLDIPNNVTLSSPLGANYFDRTYQLAYVLIGGNTTIDMKMSPLLILKFNFQSIDPASFYSTNLVANLAALLNVSPGKIRRVSIVSASNQTRIRRQLSSILLPVELQIELRDEPRSSSTISTGIQNEILSNVASIVINQYQTGEFQTAWYNRNITNGSMPSNLTVQEPFHDNTTELSVISRIELVVEPNDCRQQSPCTIQPVLVAYDSEGNIIDQLGSSDRPWQVKANIVGHPNWILPGSIANYSDGKTQFSLFNVPDMGDFQVEFAFIQPDGVSSSFLTRANLTVQNTTQITVTKAILDGKQIDKIYVVNVSETFDITLIPIDRITRLQLAQVQWGNWSWSANVTLYSLPKFNRGGSLITSSLSRTVINLVSGTVTLTNVAINATGMYILNIYLVSTNNEYVIKLPSNGILVKDVDTTLVTEMDEMLCNITFVGDYDALNSSNELEIKRAMIYNYLESIGMPLSSDIVLVKGSVVALFQVSTLSANISQAVAAIFSNTNAVPGLNITSVNINGRTLTSTPSTASDSTFGKNPSNIGLIVGLVVGLCGGLLLIVGIIFARRKHKQMNARHCTDVEPDIAENSIRIDPMSSREDLSMCDLDVDKLEISQAWTEPSLDNELDLVPQTFRSRPQSAVSHVNTDEFDDDQDRLSIKVVLPEMELIAFD